MASTNLQLKGPQHQDIGNEMDVLQRMLDFENTTLLELGCGAADKTRLIAERTGVSHIVAAEVDTIQHAINLKVTDLPKVSFESFGAQAIPYPDNHFDSVLMFKSLHHVPLDSLGLAFEEIHRVLKPGGYLYISEPVFDGAFNHMMQLFHNEEVVRLAAFNAIETAIESKLFELSEEYFFKNQIKFKSFEQYEKGVLNITHSDYKITPDVFDEVKRRFLANESNSAYLFDIPNRVDLLRKG